MIGIIDYGMSNLGSVKNALDFLNIKSGYINCAGDFEKYDKLILPGVGAFALAMEKINEKNFDYEIKENVVNKKKHLLGICLGMQLLLDDSEENGLNKGLGLISGSVKSFKNAKVDLVSTHIGWNNVLVKENSLLLDTSVTAEEYTFYFVHGFFCSAKNREDVKGLSEYGIQFDSVIEKDNIFGVQFHPEKSQKFGLNILNKFSSL